MANRLKAYVRNIILQSARDAAWPAKRRNAETTKTAFMDAMRGTDTGWWSDLIYTGPMLEMARRYAIDIVTAFNEYQDATGETFTYREHGERDRTASDLTVAIAANRLRKAGAYTLEDYSGKNGDAVARTASDALNALRFAVEWYAGDLARDYCPDL